MFLKVLKMKFTTQFLVGKVGKGDVEQCRTRLLKEIKRKTEEEQNAYVLTVSAGNLFLLFYF